MHISQGQKPKADLIQKSANFWSVLASPESLFLPASSTIQPGRKIIMLSYFQAD